MIGMFEYLTKRRVKFAASADSWESAVMQAGSLLLEDGCINQQYCEDMINMVRSNGAYIVIMPGVALAHARPNGNVFENSIAALTLSKGVNFGHSENDPVNLVFAIAARTNDEHLMLFKAVAEFLTQNESCERLLSAKSYDELLRIGDTDA